MQVNLPIDLTSQSSMVHRMMDREVRGTWILGGDAVWNGSSEVVGGGCRKMMWILGMCISCFQRR